MTNNRGMQRAQWRKVGVAFVIAVCLLAGAAYGVYWLVFAQFHETTDDAYVAGNVVAITSRENATVTALLADNTQAVHRGQLLVEMDPVMTRVNMNMAEANLARAVRTIRGTFASVDAYRAQLAEAQVRLVGARNDYDRRQSALAGAISREEVSHAHDSVQAAQAAVDAAQGGLSQAQSSITGMNTANNPEVLAAVAQLRGAAIALAHMRLVAPVDGVVAQRTVQVGQRVTAGAPLMAVVPLDNVWVDANFKEVQLARMRVGQPVTVTTDIYGSTVVFHGHVRGLGAGSGSAFAILPPQNASGNWIKIVQRVPVRIALDAGELRNHPLRVGLSVSVDVYVQDQSGPVVTNTTDAAIMRTDTDDAALAEADALANRIIAANRAVGR
jgi:membrane fusion protein (multidrug efflux system)